jgi:hypothetical protein
MRDYGKIFTRFWAFPDIASLSVGVTLIPPPVEFSMPFELLLGDEDLESTDV